MKVVGRVFSLQGREVLEPVSIKVLGYKAITLDLIIKSIRVNIISLHPIQLATCKTTSK